MKHINKILTALALVVACALQAQNTLSLDEAISSTMANNFDIQLANNSVIVAENNQSIQNSGYLPKITGNANANYNNNNAFVIDQNDNEFDISGIETTSYGASVGLNYTIYGGGTRQSQYDKLKTAYELSDIQRQLQIDNTLLNVYTTYYNIAKSTVQLDILEEAFVISKQRLIRTEYQLEFGQKTNLDVLNARVDVNNDSLNLVNAQILVNNAKRQLNYLMGQPANAEFDVEETVVVNQLLDYEGIKTNMLANNYQSKQIELNKTLSEYDLKISQSGWRPNVSTNISYGFNNSQNGPTGLFATQNTNGLNAGLNLSWNIFDGGATQVKVQNARINLENQELYKEQLNLNLTTELDNTWAEYMNQLLIINTWEQNLAITEQNFLKSQERYNLGQISSIDFRQAQLNMINAKVNLTNAKFAAKTAEIQLKKLEGKLVE